MHLSQKVASCVSVCVCVCKWVWVCVLESERCVHMQERKREQFGRPINLVLKWDTHGSTDSNTLKLQLDLKRWFDRFMNPTNWGNKVWFALHWKTLSRRTKKNYFRKTPKRVFKIDWNELSLKLECALITLRRNFFNTFVKNWSKLNFMKS